ncbi:staygreen family protein [Metabacillus iocasae]|uniref:Staygreen protein domain-containing protein n=1 Tax=Priestia iocasae TaxID=2291674 RepID=A0ABS2QSG0_9BACI|nr:staygreen family protein [Metabacillus iocasae]MBM7702401.1 hypothetical protein [Metabacillus iocasae]
MTTLNPQKLSVTYRQGVTALHPVICRKYTLTHSDETAELFLFVDHQFATDQIGPMRDEVFAEWLQKDGACMLYVYVFVGNENIDKSIQAIRYTIFKKEMPLALQAIRYGDQMFFKRYSPLDSAPIFVHFHSNDPNFHTIEYFGTPSMYA